VCVCARARALIRTTGSGLIDSSGCHSVTKNFGLLLLALLASLLVVYHDSCGKHFVQRLALCFLDPTEGPVQGVSDSAPGSMRSVRASG
jgi:hypothetical protein